ncbi:MAG TPA: di-heme oxidoredictase family protein [Myxococcaceae bacterium]|nr:di-heme oxidoredictase family protein [Myxococcaceae bacterium]
MKTFIAFRSAPVRALVSTTLLAATPALAQTNELLPPPVSAPAGSPLPGLTTEELGKFQDGKALFEHDFTEAEGLGPLFNGQSCALCHGSPVTGGSDPTGSENVVHYTIRNGDQFFQAFEHGGPVQERHAVKDLPGGSSCQLEPDTIPMNVPGMGTSIRHSPPVFGFGMLDAVSDADLRSWEGARSWKAPGVYGAANWGVEMEGLGKLRAFSLDGGRTQPIGAHRVGRFGWKAQTSTLFQFSSEPFNIELGMSTPFFARENTPDGAQPPPECLNANQPNDVGSQQTLLLYYFQAFLAPPERGPINAEVTEGEKVFRRVGCDDCHRERLRTVADYYAPWPDGTVHRVEALSHKVLAPYSDLLLHDMGPELEDVRPMGRASGRMWRTTPLWGLRHKQLYLHDGSATTLEQAILKHGGEGQWSTDAYLRLSTLEKQQLKAFLDSL